MKIFIAIVVVGAIIWLVISVVRSRHIDGSPEYATIDRIPSIVSKLREHGQNSSFVVLMFRIPGNNDEIFPNIQYSIDNDKLGFDWVLIAPQNIKDEEAIGAFCTKQGYVVSQREMNGVRFLRVEGNEIENLGVKVLRDFYHLAQDTQLELIVDGFGFKE